MSTSSSDHLRNIGASLMKYQLDREKSPAKASWKKAGVVFKADKKLPCVELTIKG